VTLSVTSAAQIVPPRGWFSRSYDISQLQCQVSAPVSQHVAGKKGIFNVDLVERKTMSPEEFQGMTEIATDKEPADTDDPTDVERRFWKGLRGTMDAPVYGADIVASLFGDADAMSWNLNDLNTILRKIDLPGVTRSMLYFGMWRAMFAFHTVREYYDEDVVGTRNTMLTVALSTCAGRYGSL